MIDDPGVFGGAGELGGNGNVDWVGTGRGVCIDGWVDVVKLGLGNWIKEGKVCFLTQRNLV